MLLANKQKTHLEEKSQKTKNTIYNKGPHLTFIILCWKCVKEWLPCFLVGQWAFVASLCCFSLTELLCVDSCPFVVYLHWALVFFLMGLANCSHIHQFYGIFGFVGVYLERIRLDFVPSLQLFTTSSFLANPYTSTLPPKLFCHTMSSHNPPFMHVPILP
jgi:hypothetical protein